MNLQTQRILFTAFILATEREKLGELKWILCSLKITTALKKTETAFLNTEMLNDTKFV